MEDGLGLVSLVEDSVPSCWALLLGGYVQFGDLRLHRPPPSSAVLPAHQSPNSSGMAPLSALEH